MEENIKSEEGNKIANDQKACENVFKTGSLGKCKSKHNEI